MEAFIGFVQSALGLKARQGWIFLLVGISMLLSVYFGFLENSELATGWKAFFTLLTVTGFVVLLVSAGSTAYNTVELKISDRRKLAEAKATREKEDKNSVAVARVLRGKDAGVLLALLERGEQRFSYRGDIAGLWTNKLIRAVLRNGSVFDIVDPVWQDREQLIPILRKRQNE